MFEPLSQVLILLAGSVFLVTVARRLGLPTTLAYLVVGLVLGPHALAVMSDSGTTRLLADVGVAFLLFTLGLEFSLPGILALRRGDFGLGGRQGPVPDARGRPRRGRGHSGRRGGAGGRALAVASLVPRDRPQPPARAVHPDSVVRRAGIGMGLACRGPVARAGGVPVRNDA